MRSRIVLLLAMSLLLATALSAQQAKQKPQKPLDPRDVEALTGRPYNGSQPEAKQSTDGAKTAEATKSRPPMDWRDVDILTGRAEREARERRAYAQPYYYFDVSPYDSDLSDSDYSRLDGDASWRLSPRGFGRGHSDFIFFTPRFWGPSVFFPHQTFRGSVFIF
jgi:hypothetical protein